MWRGARIALALLALGLPAMAQETAADRPAPKPDTAQTPDPATDPARPPQSGPATTEDAPATDEPAAAEQGDPAPSGNDADQTPPATIPPEDEFAYSACLLTLYSLGSRYEELPAIRETDQPGCGMERPLRISEILPGLTLSGAPVMRCETARQLAFWSRDHLLPATHFLPGAARLTTIEPGSTYQCRDVIGNGGGGDLSEHATGNAFDIMAFGFSDGSRFDITPRQDSGDLAEAFQAAIRSAACLYFTTVLGPGANAAHDDHLHFDVKPRNGGWRLCQ
ncbi:extensin family protein [Paracoccus sp. DMF-8]|uniref:extensin-like domain-containing protein n=1 Tax=Paracoccus sp. DMF-8 TaxID=3019445 RepID=UPI0023E7E7BB|nr:extensin family protein [Paracoccus sp. DMF-8]MDF3606863.1 extensin family protein [Paracoccus sp. DMF-8]